MKLNVIISVVVAGTCIGVLWSVQARHRQLAALRTEENQLLTQAAGQPEASSTTLNSTPGMADHSPAHASVSPELLRLRGDVTRLMGRQRELSGVRAENDRLHAQIATQSTNPSARASLPPGYVLRTQAKWSGFATPDDTIQSFLWAAQNHDMTKLLQTLTPEAAQQTFGAGARSAVSDEKMMEEGISHFPGMRIVDRQLIGQDTWELKVQIVPEDTETQPMRVRLINGEWKLDFRAN